MLIVVVILFIMCWGPNIIIETLIGMGKQQFSQTFYALQIVFTLLQFVHCCINPIIYCFMSKNFRRSMSRVIARPANACHKLGRICKSGSRGGCCCCCRRSRNDRDIYLKTTSYEMTSLYLPDNTFNCHKNIEVTYKGDEDATAL